MSRQNFNFRFSQKQRIVAAYTKIAMNDAGSITMTMRPPDRLKVIQAVVDGCLTESMTANWSQLTKRLVNRLVKITICFQADEDQLT